MGRLGAAILDHVIARGWAVRQRKTRVIRFSPAGEQKMRARFSREPGFPASPNPVAAAETHTYLKLQQLSYAPGGFRTAQVFARLPL